MREEYRRTFRPPGGGWSGGLDEEMAFHIAALVDALVAEGWTAEAARAEALRRFGDPAAVRAACRRERRRGMGMVARVVGMVWQDASYAVRQLMRRPLASGLALLTLVLGVGATTVVFSVVHATVLRPLPFEDPGRLVRVSQTSPQGRAYSISEPNFIDFRSRQKSFTGMAGLGFVSPVLTGDGEARALDGMRVTHEFFPLLGIQPVAGRTFLPEEDVRGGAGQVAMLSEGAWRRRFGGDPAAVGRTLMLDGVPRQVVGVAASDGAWPGVEVFIPLSPDPDGERDNQIMEAIGRLAPGVGLADAGSDMTAIARELAQEYPESNEGWGAQVVPLRDWLVGPRVTRMGIFLLGAVGLLLLMACVSVTNLRVAEASSRMQEMGVRASLGAGRRRIALQLLVESLVLATIGGVLAVGIAYQALPLLRALGPGDVARLQEAGINAPVLAVALAAAVLAVVVSGLAPAAVVIRSGVFHSLRAGAGHLAGQGRRLRDVLVVTQFALAVAVVLAAGLMTRSFLRLQNVDLGFEPSGMVRFAVRLPDMRYGPEERGRYLLQLQEALEAVPGVQAAGATSAPPFGWSTPSNFVARSDREPDRQQDFEPVSWRAVSGDYFEAAGIRLLSGRTFRSDHATLPDAAEAGAYHPPIIIDRALAERLWPGGEDPVGRLLSWFQPGGLKCRIVGVVSSVRDERVDAAPRPRVYHPYAFAPWAEPSVLVRTAGDPAPLIPALRRATLAVDPDVPAMSPTLTRHDVRQKVAWPRLGMQILAAFGVAALLLAAMGIYGVTAYGVNRRRREIGVRMALGADPAGVLGLVLRRVMALAGAGIAAGLGLSLLLTGFLERILYDVSALDPVTFVAVPTLLALVALAAAWIPARRAMRLNPRDALVPD